MTQIFWQVWYAVLLTQIHVPDILGSREQWDGAQEEVLSGLSPEAMASYGEEYIRSMQQRLVHMSSASSSDTGPYLEDLKHAILSPRPKPFYYPGASAWALPLLYRHCPTSLSDRILSRIFTSSYAQPAEVLNSWFELLFCDVNGAGITHTSHLHTSPDFLWTITQVNTTVSVVYSLACSHLTLFHIEQQKTARIERNCIAVCIIDNGPFFTCKISPDFL